jgi:hypothetical protein
MNTTRSRYVYRIENGHGQGPYTTDFWPRRSSSPYFGPRHLGPRDDSGLDWDCLALSYKYSFGFRSMEQMRFWFYRKEWRGAMQKAGYRLTKWRVSAGDARLSDAQAVFRRDLSTLVETIDLN